MNAVRDTLGGWRLVAFSGVAVGAMCMAILAVHGVGPEALGAAIRATARTSLLLFAAAYAGPALHRLRPSVASAWTVRQRGPLFYSFAASHAWHALFIAWLVLRYAAPGEFTWAGAAGGLLGYAFIVALVVTSFERPAAWIGASARRRLHTGGVHFIWFAFAFTWAGRVAEGPSLLQALFFALALAALAVRIAGGRWQRSALSPVGAGS